MSVKAKHPHYYKNVAHLQMIDVYRVLERFEVQHPTIQHAVKKLLVAGGRGAGKDLLKDVQEAIDSLSRFCDMHHEDSLENCSKQDADDWADAASTFVREGCIKPLVSKKVVRKLAAKGSKGRTR